MIFSVAVINDVSLNDALQDSDLRLMDINDPGLQLVGQLARKLAQARGGRLKVSTTSELGRALEGADFVVNAAAVAERNLWPLERDIARRHGYWPSKGFRFQGLRNNPLALRIAQEMERYCPDAWLLQHSNPMVGNVGAVSRYTRVRVAGFCHGVEHTVQRLARWMQVDRSALDVEAVGINHFLFISKWYRDARDAYAELLEWNESAFPAVWETEDWKESLDAPGPVSRDLCLRFGAFPCNGDEHMSDYFAWYTSSNEDRLRYRAKTDYLDRYLARGEERWAQWSALAGASPADVAQAFKTRSGEAAAEVMAALCSPGQSYLVHVILPNHGAVPEPPWDSAVELPAVVTTDNIRALGEHHLTAAGAPHIARRLAEEEFAMTAALEGNRDLVYRALELDPYTRSTDQMAQYVKALADVNKEYLPWLS